MQLTDSQFILLNLPIGNIGDLTEKVLTSLKTGQIFFAEDTRKFKSLLSHLEISLDQKQIFSFHDHSQIENFSEKVESFLSAGQNVYYVSDAGSPSLSDPAAALVSLGWKKNWSIDSYSGISAFLMGLELSGFHSVPLFFHGFSSRDNKKREQFFKQDLGSAGTHIWFEPPHRASEILNLLSQFWPEEEIFIGRELTKKFQSVHRFYLKDLNQVLSDINFKGEFVFVLKQTGSKKQQLLSSEMIDLAHEIEKRGPQKKLVAKLLSKITQSPVKEIYSKWTTEH